MPYALKPDISFCRVAGRTMFLDLAADRYFCLSPAGDDAFAKLVDGVELNASDIATLDHLTSSGPLVRSASPETIFPCPALVLPKSSLLDKAATLGFGDVIAAGVSLLSARMTLRAMGLRSVVRRVARRKARLQPSAGVVRQTQVAIAFTRLRDVVTETDNCLTRSLAVAGRLIAVGAPAELVIAVKLQPFAAHAWVQCEGQLVNDRYEFVREYTPILFV